MQRAFDQFTNNMKYVAELDALYLYLRDTLHLPNDLSDLLRAEWVYTVSAIDKLIHELIRIGMIEAFQGRRAKTKKFLSFNISLNTHTSIVSSHLITVPPAEYWFDQEVIQKHKTLSFQEPEKIADGLSLIWEEQHKWQTIGTAMALDQNDLITRLKTIIARRNQIVHEADLDLLSGVRNPILKSDVEIVVPFITKLAGEIFNAVR